MIPLDGKLKIRISIEGECTSIYMFITPTGTETYLMQNMVESIDVIKGQKEIEYIWEVPKGTMGHFGIIAYDKMVGRKVYSNNIYSE